jgi:murein DD-endopeptidase MepM/ murein hydrolase activator NlpD
MKVLLLAFFVFFSTLSAAPAVAGKALSKKSTKQRSAARGPIVVRLNSPAAADQSHVIDTSLEQGCLTNEQKRLLTWQLGVEEQELQHFLLDANPLGLQTRGKDCLHYASAVAPKGDVNSLAVLSRASTTDQPIALFMSKSANEDKPVIRRLELPLSSLALTEVHLPASDLDTLPVEHIEKIPMHLRWELGLLVRRMIAGLDASEAHELRIVLEKIPEQALEKVLAVELIDTLRGKVKDRVIWFERADQRGAFFSTASGTDYARMLWYSPTRHVNISRGVGESVTTVRRKVATHAHGKKKPRFKTRRYSYRGQHIGIDFVAPAGTPVHAVADAEVVFASTMGGYGNLVILSHGQGYETYYAHLSGFAPDLVPGKKVLRGEEIAYVGSTGLSTGPHLHYELRKEKRYINPFDKQAALEFWNLQPEEHEQMLALMLVLDFTREADDNAEQAGNQLPLPAAYGQFRVNYRAR